ncbi:cupin domain-containing protein [Halalkalicoccus sp. NIPERK01]|uniref:cupin domain-containing protein n=1 Tax=Halalkalicoccus sp. NIPERK01 TaxID=3053469 RepID=UPI00256EC018|nr:cupin domain-containing protein [Halalkalicoccus sp. NIPERK01]MDL5362989.1 cupin domain-containing protein [Halalkalicoccus sp. NIPERK01]
MGYQVIDPEAIDPTPDRPCTHRAIGSAADLSELAMNVYEADPGEQLPLAYHYHDDQEEAFYVLSGTLTVETPDGEYTADAGEVFVADPESPHRAYNAGTEGSLSVLAIGAPPVDDAHPYESDR